MCAPCCFFLADGVKGYQDALVIQIMIGASIFDTHGYQGRPIQVERHLAVFSITHPVPDFI